MPQLILELSSNIIEQDGLNDLLQSCHSVLVSTLPTDIKDCKSRVVLHDHYYIGDGNSNNAFINVDLKVLRGRDAKTLQATAQAVMRLLQDFFSKSLYELNVQITLELTELSEIYLKETHAVHE